MNTYTRYTCLLILLTTQVAAAEISTDTIREISTCSERDRAYCPSYASLLDAASQALPAVGLALRHEDRDVRSAAASLMAEESLGSKQVRFTQIAESLQVTPDALRGESYEALAHIGTAAAAEPLRAAVIDQTTDARNRIFAARALGHFSNEQATSALVQALRDATPRVQQAAAGALGRQASSQSIPALINRALSEITAGYVREACIVAWAPLKDPRTLAPMVLLLASEHDTVRSAAIRGLGILGDTAALPALLTRLLDAATLPALVQTLGGFTDPRATSGLLQLATRSDVPKEVRIKALWTLGEKPVAETIPGIAEVLSDPSPDIVYSAAEALGRISQSPIIPHLIPLLTHTAPRIQQIAQWGLEKVTGQSFGLEGERWRRYYEAERSGLLEQ